MGNKENKKSTSLVTRFKKRAIIKSKASKNTQASNIPATETAANTPLTEAQALAQKQQIQAFVMDMSLKALYNNGNRQDLKFVEEILTPNNVRIDDAASLEILWDIITNTPFIKAKIGFKNDGSVSITNTGYDLMSQYGSYMNYMKAVQDAKNQQMAPENDENVQLIGKAAKPDFDSETELDLPDGVH